MRIAVTGATGYIGQRLVRAARLAGYQVLALSRRPVSEAGVEWQPFDLGDEAPLSLPADIFTVFHLAANTQYEPSAQHNEHDAAERLIGAASAVGAHFVFVSSQTACSEAATAYGRIKWQIERTTLAAGGWVVRPGQVYGGLERGLFGGLCALVRRFPLLPAFVPAPVVQPVHVDDLVDALLKCVTRVPSSVLCVAAPEGTDFVEFLQAIARGRTGRRLIFIPVPTLLIRAAFNLLGASLSGRLSLDRLLSLFTLRKMDTAGDLQRLSVKLRPLSAGVTRSGTGRRELLCESRAFLTYVLREVPAGGVMRRYVKAIEALRKVRALALPAFAQRTPALLALFEEAPSINDEFRCELSWRLNTALMLAEASPQGARRFLGIGKPCGFYRSSLGITWAVLMEFGRRMVQLFLRPFFSRIGRRGIFR